MGILRVLLNKKIILYFILRYFRALEATKSCVYLMFTAHFLALVIILLLRGIITGVLSEVLYVCLINALMRKLNNCS